jgi:hypothetical protein
MLPVVPLLLLLSSAASHWLLLLPLLLLPSLLHCPLLLPLSHDVH